MLDNAEEKPYVDQVVLSMKLAWERREYIVHLQRDICRQLFFGWVLRGCDVKVIKVSRWTELS